MDWTTSRWRQREVGASSRWGRATSPPGRENQNPTPSGDGIPTSDGRSPSPDTIATMPQFGHAEEVICCFCDLPKQPEGQLIAGPRIYICDTCIAMATAVIETGDPMPSPTAMVEPVPKASDDEHRCSFCGKFRHKVDGMAAAGEVCICVECLELCSQILAEQLAGQAPPIAANGASGNPTD